MNFHGDIIIDMHSFACLLCREIRRREKIIAIIHAYFNQFRRVHFCKSHFFYLFFLAIVFSKIICPQARLFETFDILIGYILANV